MCPFSPPSAAGPEHSSALAAPGSAQLDTGTQKSPSVSGESGAEQKGGCIGGCAAPSWSWPRCSRCRAPRQSSRWWLRKHRAVPRTVAER